METERKFISADPPVHRMVEDIVGCKWSLAVLKAIRKQVRRPGEIRRFIGIISTKVLNERLSKMVRYGILTKQSYSEVPPRVEYRFTPFGEQFVAILDQIDRLQAERSGDQNA